MKTWEYVVKIHTRDFTRRITVHEDGKKRFVEKLKSKIRGEFDIDVLRDSRCINIKVFSVQGDKRTEVEELTAFVQCSPKEFVKRLF